MTQLASPIKKIITIILVGAVVLGGVAAGIYVYALTTSNSTPSTSEQIDQENADNEVLQNPEVDWGTLIDLGDQIQAGDPTEINPEAIIEDGAM